MPRAAPDREGLTSLTSLQSLQATGTARVHGVPLSETVALMPQEKPVTFLSSSVLDLRPAPQGGTHPDTATAAKNVSADRPRPAGKPAAPTTAMPNEQSNTVAQRARDWGARP